MLKKKVLFKRGKLLPKGPRWWDETSMQSDEAQIYIYIANCGNIWLCHCHNEGGDVITSAWVTALETRQASASPTDFLCNFFHLWHFFNVAMTFGSKDKRSPRKRSLANLWSPRLGDNGWQLAAPAMSRTTRLPAGIHLTSKQWVFQLCRVFALMEPI